MRLRAHVILKSGRFLRAGEEINEAEIPAEIAMRYRQVEEDVSPRTETQASSSTFIEEQLPKQQRKKAKRPTYVFRNGSYVPLNEITEKLSSGEPLYWKRPKGFGQNEAYIKFGSAK